MKRFKTVTCNLEDPEGKWVEYEAHLKEIERLRKALIKIRDGRANRGWIRDSYAFFVERIVEAALKEKA